MTKFYYLIFCLICCQLTKAQELDTTMWVANGKVHALTKVGNTIYLGGEFNHVGPNTGGGTVYDPSSDKIETSFPRINGKIDISISDEKGGWFLVGDFTNVGGFERQKIVHILSDNSLDLAWNPSIDGDIRCLAIANNILYIGGYLNLPYTPFKTGIIALSAITGQATDWQTEITDGVTSLIVFNGNVYAGGHFELNSGQKYLASFDQVTGQTTSWNPKPNGYISQILIHQNIIYVHGGFSQIDGEERSRIAAVDASTGRATSFNPSPGDQIFNFTLANDTLYISGRFFSIANQYRYQLASINLLDGKLTDWNPNLYPHGFSLPKAIAVVGNNVYVGDLNTPIIQNHGTLAVIDKETSEVTSWEPLVNGPILTLSVYNGKIFIGGKFSSVGGKPRISIAAIDAISGKVLPWNPQVNSVVYTLAFIGNTLFIGGSFFMVGGKQRIHFAGIDANSGGVTNLQINVSAPITQMIAYKNKLYLAGRFNRTGDILRQGIAQFDPFTGKITNWDAKLNAEGYVKSLTVLNNKLYIEGDFTQAGNEPHRNLAALDIGTGNITPWVPSIDFSHIYAITSFNGNIYVSGEPLNTAGNEKFHLVAFNPETGLALESNIRTDYPIASIAQANDSILYLGGNFTSINGYLRKKLAAINLRTGLITDWKANVGEYPFATDSPEVKSVFISGKSMYVIGNFRSVNYFTLGGGFAVFGERPEGATNTIKGNIFNDANANCNKEPVENSLENLIVQAQPGGYYTSTDSLGNYELKVPRGTYTLSQLLPRMKGFDVKQICPVPDYSIDFTSTNEVITNKDFSNQANIQPFLAVDITSDRRRRCFTSQTVVYYRNEGFASASNVQIKVVYPEHVIPISSSVPWKSKQGDTLFFELNTLIAQSSGSITIKDSVVCGNETIRGLTQCTKAIIIPGNQLPQDSRWDQSSLALFATCKDNGFVRLVIKNTGKGNMADSTAYRIFLDAQMVFSANCQLNSKDSLVLEVPVNGKTIRLEADQRPYHPGESKPSITLEGCGSSASIVISKGFVDQLPQDDAAEEVAISCMEILDSYDPNDKQSSPSGLAATHMIRQGEELEYTIRFQNTGSDVAYTVVIEDELHENLDLATLRMGASSHPNTWKISGEGKPKITWTFNNINLPDSTSNEKASHGFVSFRIRQKEDNTIGASIANQAYITFDFNSPIATNVVYHTVGEFPIVDAKIAINICDGSKPDSAVAGNNIFLTEQSSTQLSANQPGKGYGRWKLISGTATIVNPEDPQTLITNLGAGKNVLEWTIYFCSQTSASQVTVERIVIPPVPVVSNPAPYCANEAIQPLLAQGQNIEWFADATLQTLLATGESYQPATSQSDTVYVTQTISGYRSIAKQVIVTILPPVSVPKVPAMVYYCKTDESVSITAEGENVEWFSDAILQTKIGSSTNLIIHTTEDRTMYVTQQVNGCRSTPGIVNLKASVFEPKNVFIANVITPNGDNKNEAFTAPQLDSGSCIGKFRHVQIFNRFGKKVFESSHEQFTWNGAGTSAGVYYYVLSYSGFTYSGTVSVLY